MDYEILRVSKWASPVSHYREETVEDEYGKVRITKVTYDPGLYLMEGVDGYDFYLVEKPIKVTVLQEWNRYKHDWEDLMVDDPLHSIGMLRLAQASDGNVLVAGLGLGLVVHYLARNPRVKKITVVENNPLVIKLVSKYIRYDNVEIVEDDVKAILVTSKPMEMKYDTAILDIWKTSHDTPEEERKNMANEMRILYLMTALISRKVYIWGLRNRQINPAVKKIVEYPGIEFERSK